MIEIIPSLLTPAMLAMSPLNTPAVEHEYDWQQQRSLMHIDGELISPENVGTMNGTKCFIDMKTVIDDWRQD